MSESEYRRKSLKLVDYPILDSNHYRFRLYRMMYRHTQTYKFYRACTFKCLLGPGIGSEAKREIEGKEAKQWVRLFRLSARKGSKTDPISLHFAYCNITYVILL